MKYLILILLLAHVGVAQQVNTIIDLETAYSGSRANELVKMLVDSSGNVYTAFLDFQKSSYKTFVKSQLQINKYDPDGKRIWDFGKNGAITIKTKYDRKYRRCVLDATIVNDRICLFTNSGKDLNVQSYTLDGEKMSNLEIDGMEYFSCRPLAILNNGDLIIRLDQARKMINNSRRLVTIDDKTIVLIGDPSFKISCDIFKYDKKGKRIKSFGDSGKLTVELNSNYHYLPTYQADQIVTSCRHLTNDQKIKFTCYDSSGKGKHTRSVDISEVNIGEYKLSLQDDAIQLLITTIDTDYIAEKYFMTAYFDEMDKIYFSKLEMEQERPTEYLGDVEKNHYFITSYTDYGLLCLDPDGNYCENFGQDGKLKLPYGRHVELCQKNSSIYLNTFDEESKAFKILRVDLRK